MAVPEWGRRGHEVPLAHSELHMGRTVRFADRIFVLEANRLIEDGEHAALLWQGGRYAAMLTVQANASRLNRGVTSAQGFGRIPTARTPTAGAFVPS